MTVLLMAAMALSYWDKAVLGLAAVPIMTELHLSNSMYGLASSSFYLLFSVTAVLVGLMVNRIRSRWVFVVLALLWAVAQSSLVLTSTVAALFVARILIGAAEGPANPLAVHTVHSWFPPQRRSLPTALSQIASAIGALTSAPILTWVIIEHGWRWGFLTTALLSALWALVYAIFGKDRPVETAPSTEDVEDAEAAERVGQFTDLPDARVAYRRILLCGTFVGAVAMAIAAQWNLAVIVSWLVPFFVKVAGFSASAAGNMVILPNLVAIIGILAIGAMSGRLIARGVSDRYPLGVITGLTVTTGGICTLLVPYLGTGALLVCGVPLAVGLPLVAVTSAFNAVGRICPPAQRGAVMGTLQGLYAIGSIAGPYTMGLVLDAHPDAASGYGTGFTITGVLVVVGGMCAVLLVNPSADRHRLAADTTSTANQPSGIAAK